MQRLLAPQTRNRRTCVLELARYACAALLCMMATTSAYGQTTNYDDEAVKRRVQLVEKQIAEVQQTLDSLPERISPLAEEARGLKDQISDLKSREDQPEKPRPKDPRKVPFRPPLRREADKSLTEQLVFLCEDSRITVIPIKKISDVINGKLDGVIVRVRGGERKIHETWKVDEGAFDVEFDLEVAGPSGLVSFKLVRKSGEDGETIDELKRADSPTRVAVEQADAGKTLVMIAAYPDSFEAFREVRSMIWNKKLPYDWLPLTSGQEIRLGGGGGTMTAQ